MEPAPAPPRPAPPQLAPPRPAHPRPAYPVLVGSVPAPGAGWVHWPRSSAMLREPYDVLSLKARLDHGRTAPEDRAAAFRHLDTDASGKLSVDELLSALQECCVIPDPAAPGNRLYGPLG
ncbi:hypothetical protein GCM10009759_37540 [Kitasatospora saccharophila]|uniref:EF-hand domain-containing protein n=1 Tax=Kitasatospora saccharophila TaxID=407973 RepID=A0ABN2X126_9ACTN